MSYVLMPDYRPGTRSSPARWGRVYGDSSCASAGGDCAR